MLPVVLYKNMEGGSNSLNNNLNSSYGSLYDENIILNSVRSRKKVSELPNCPVCGCTIRQGELDNHLASELERLQKITSGGNKRKLSVNSSGSGSSLAVPGSSSNLDVENDQDVDVTGCVGGDVYQRVHTNRLRRLRARRKTTPPPQQGDCPVCNETLPMSKLQRHALRCLKRTGADVEDVPDSSDEDGSIDVEGEEGGSFGAEYYWCGERRIRAAALQPGLRETFSTVRSENDHALVVDGDEDTELYGPPQFSPSRIAPDADMEDTIEQTESETANIDVINNENGQISNGQSDHCHKEQVIKPNGLVEASAETRIQALKAKIKDLENKQNSASEAKCLICLGPYVSPTVSIQCWHVHCEICWIQSLRAKKICPQCNVITTSIHLRRIYM